MESRGTLPAPALGADDAPDVAALFERSGPFVTVYLSTDPEVEQASQRSVAHWRNVRRDLEGQDAPGDALDAIEALVPDAHLEGNTLVAVADADGVALVRHGQEPITADRGLWTAVPAVGTLLEWQQSSPTHAVVLADRVGADVAIFTAHGEGGDAMLAFGDTHTDDPVLRKTKPGGWSQRRFQQRAENSWDANMKAVAERMGKIAQIVDLRLVVLAGDVRAVPMLREHLPPHLADRIYEIEGQRAIDGGIDAIADDVTRTVATAVASDTVAILEKFREERGQGDRAADGIAATLAALSEARVDTLLVHDDPSDSRECWFAPTGDVALAATDAVTIKAQGVADPAKGRLVDVAIRTAFRSGARVRVIPSAGVTDGIGAILRY